MKEFEKGPCPGTHKVKEAFANWATDFLSPWEF